MVNSHKSKNENRNIKIKDVLFQKIGATWFIFAESEGELVYSIMPDGMDPRTTKLELYQIIEEHMERVQGNKRAPRTVDAV